MNSEEARALMGRYLAEYRQRSYADLAKLADQPKVTLEILGESGTTYYLDIDIWWDDRSKGTLRVVTAIDDGGWRAFAPLADDFILAPDGTFLGE